MEVVARVADGADTAETKPSLAAGAASDARPEATSVAGKDYFTIGSTKEEVLAVQGIPFTVGSTRDEVLVVQGTPLSFNDTHFTYPTGAQVFFTDGRVTSWRMTPAFPLKVESGK